MDGLAITHEINRVSGENTISYSTIGKCVRMFALSTKETDTPVVPNRKVISVLTTASPCSLKGAISFSSPNWQEGDDVEINSVSPFDAGHEMEIAESSGGPSQFNWV
jgi:hypothetical protein